MLLVEPPFLLEKPVFYLVANRAFVPKTNAEVALVADFEIKDIFPDPSSRFERCLCLMCPVRALKIYSDCSREVKRSTKSLDCPL